MVSVVIATYNMARYVQGAVNSVLAQDYPSVEIIIVDDGSSDDTPQVLSCYINDPSVIIITQKNMGQAFAKNRGIKEARGEYIAFCDADDTWIENKLTSQIPLFDKQNRIAVVYGDILIMDSKGNVISAPPMRRYNGKITCHLLVDNFIPFTSAVVRRSVIDEMGGFDESLLMGIDYELWLRISVKYEFVYVAKPLACYRMWEGQMSRQVEERFDNYFLFLKRFLATYPGIVSANDVRKAWAHTFVSRGLWRYSLRQKKLALWDLGRAFRYRPFDYRLWKSFVKFLIGRR